MTKLIANLSLSLRYTLFVFGIITILIIASYQITSMLISDGMRELYEQRLKRCQSTFSQYADVHYVSKAKEIEAVVTSPRFLAAVATADHQTIANEVPYYRNILGASVFELVDAANRPVYSYATSPGGGELDEKTQATIHHLLTDDNYQFQAHYLLVGSELFELFETDILTHDGLYVGRLLVGTEVSGFLIDDLERLTGFDIIVAHKGVTVAQSNTELVTKIHESRANRKELATDTNQIRSIELGQSEALLMAATHDRLNVSVTFVGLPDQQLAPILRYVRLYLIGLALLGGLLTLVVVYYYTSRRIGRKIDTLVEATNSISQGKLNFELKADSKDEFGALSTAINRMKTMLKLNRDEIHSLHQERLQSERLASLGKSATGIIHDFKSPMAVIRGTVELVSLKRKDDVELVGRLETITNQIDQMNQLTQDVIEFSRGKFKLNIEQITLMDYFTDILSSQTESFERAGIELTIDASEDFVVKLDPSRFRRVIDNILNNAREALKPGQQVSLDWKLTDLMLQLTISDNGPGIPEPILDKIFDPFVTSGKESGTGLGLAIAKKIVEDHNANIAVTSELNIGTTFTIEIPQTMIGKIVSTASLVTEEI